MTPNHRSPSSDIRHHRERRTNATAYHVDASLERYGDLAIGGSPLRLFRLTDAGCAVLDRIVSGEVVGGSKLVDALLDAGAIHPDTSSRSGNRHPARFAPDDVTVVIPTLGPADRAPTGSIVVDDGSTPPVTDATLRLDHNQGPGAARNAGLALVTTPLVAFVDSDVDLPAGWLDRVLPHFDDERVGLVAPRVGTAPGLTSRLARYERDRAPLDLGPAPARIRAGTRVSYVPAAAIVCQVEAVSAVGGFDPDLRFGEDVDLVWRLDTAGWRCRYEPASVVHHDPRRDWRAWWRQRVAYGASAAPLAKRHPGALAPLRSNAWSVVAWMLVTGRRPVTGAAVGFGSAIALTRKLPDLPPRVAVRLAARGHALAGDQIATAVRRAWWPLLVLAALRSRFARRALLVSMLVARDPIRVADDVAYSVGLWRGVMRERTADPLLPSITSWPARRHPAGGATWRLRRWTARRSSG